MSRTVVTSARATRCTVPPCSTTYSASSPTRQARSVGAANEPISVSVAAGSLPVMPGAPVPVGTDVAGAAVAGAGPPVVGADGVVPVSVDSGPAGVVTAGPLVAVVALSSSSPHDAATSATAAAAAHTDARLISRSPPGPDPPG